MVSVLIEKWGYLLIVWGLEYALHHDPIHGKGSRLYYHHVEIEGQKAILAAQKLD